MGSRGDVNTEDPQLAGLASAISEGKVKQQKGMVRRIWSAMGLVGHLFFRNSKEDFEKRLQHLSKEEVAVHNRLKRRTQLWRKFARSIILYSVIGEVLILGVAIYSTRNALMTWQTRAWRVLPVFALPLITTLLYSSCASFYRMRERKDQRTLEKLRTERKEKIDELKEKTNYYLTQQLIQKYDMDPAAKAAAASVLASKLGSESGLKFALQAAEVLETEENGKSSSSGRKTDKEVADSSGLRNRRTVSRKDSQVDRRPSFGQSSLQPRYTDRVEGPEYRGVGPMQDEDAWEHAKEVEHHRGKPEEGGWIARLAAMLVGEDPSQCYALICAKCHMHNGLAKKEDYQYITYYCPHCHALNKSNQLEGGDGTNRSPGAAGSPTNRIAGPEEVFSTSGGSSSPPTQDAASNSAMAGSSALTASREPLVESESDNNLSDD
ncbi:unnamed protein product [Calypogeia fissa]